MTGFIERLKAKQKIKINDLIFKELIKRGYSLEGNTKVWNIADSKLWYLTPEQAQAFLDLEKEESYKKGVIQKELDLINENIDFILKRIGKEPINLIDLGCGDGKKAVIFINHLKGKLKLRYCPIDISNYMVEKAIRTVKESMRREEDIVKFRMNISDFENLENVTASLTQSCNLQGDCFKKNFFLLLDNTLGNFEINEFLYEISSSMQKGNFLLIGNGLNNQQVDDIIRSYHNQQMNDWAIKNLTQIGLKKEDVKFGVRFRNSRIEVYYTVLKDTKITFLGRTVEFNKGDQIIVIVSYKYTQEMLIKFLRMYFHDVKMFISPDKSYAIVLCQK